MEIQKNKRVEWVDIVKPAAKEIDEIRKRFDLHPVIADELKGPSARARVEAYGSYLFFVYYFPKYDVADETSVRTEIDFIITKDAVITIHYAPVTEALQHFKVTDEKNSLELLYHIMESLITFEERQLRHVREKVEHVGHEIFRDKEREVLQKISYLKRDVSEYRIVVRLQELIFSSLITKGKRFWGESAEVYLNDLAGDHLKIVNQLEDYRDAISDFEDTNNQLMSLKTSSVMKTFTALSFLTFPFMLLAGIFSMNTPDTPIVSMPHGFWIILAVMAVLMAALVAYFRKKRWF